MRSWILRGRTNTSTVRRTTESNSPVPFLAVIMAVMACHLTVLNVMAAPLYSVIDLGDLGDDESLARAINDSGVVVGWSKVGSDDHAFAWDPANLMIDLGILDSGQGNPRRSRAYDINNSSTAVGLSRGLPLDRAVVWPDVTAPPLDIIGTFPARDPFARAFGINDAGVIVGESQFAQDGSNDGIRGFKTSDSGLIVLEDLPNGSPKSSANAINNNGDAVGLSSTTNDDGFQVDRAVMWPDEDPMNPIDLGDLIGGQDFSVAEDVNDLGQVVGSSEAGSGIRAFSWTQETGMVALDIPDGRQTSQAWGINNLNQIVGESDEQAVLWDPIMGVLDLNVLLDASGNGWDLDTAFDINNRGQIVGLGINPDGDSHAFLLNPIPEPSALAILGLSLWLVIGHKRD